VTIPEPKLGTFGFSDPDANDFFQALQIDTDHQVHGFIDHPPVFFNLDDERIEIKNRINRFQRARLPRLGKMNISPNLD
jgi:hypothetical protein